MHGGFKQKWSGECISESNLTNTLLRDLQCRRQVNPYSKRRSRRQTKYLLGAGVDLEKGVGVGPSPPLPLKKTKSANNCEKSPIALESCFKISNLAFKLKQ